MCTLKEYFDYSKIHLQISYILVFLILAIMLILFIIFFIFIHNKGINIHMTYSNNDNNLNEIITMSLCL